MDDDGSVDWVNSANPPEMIMKLMLLEKKEGFIRAFMAVKKQNVTSGRADYSRTASWLAGLWLECSGILQRENQELYDDLEVALRSQAVDDHMGAFCKLMVWLDKKGLRWDTRKTYNRHSLKEVVGHSETIFST